MHEMLSPCISRRTYEQQRSWVTESMSNCAYNQQRARTYARWNKCAAESICSRTLKQLYWPCSCRALGRLLRSLAVRSSSRATRSSPAAAPPATGSSRGREAPGAGESKNNNEFNKNITFKNWCLITIADDWYWNSIIIMPYEIEDISILVNVIYSHLKPHKPKRKYIL